MEVSMRFRLPVLLAAQLLRAQQPVSAPMSAPPANLARHDSVVVTGTASPAPLEESDRDIEVLPLPPAHRPLFSSWFGALQLDPSLDLRQRAPGGFLADLSIRGAGFGQTLVLVDGVRVNDAQTGHFNLDLPLPLEAIAGLEILRGAGSTLYGSDAIGGVVNVRSRVFETPEVRFSGGLGNFGSDEEHGLASVGGSKWDERLSFARDRSTGFAPDRDYRNLALSSRTGYRWAPGAGHVLLGYSDRPYGADQFYGNYPSWERIKTWFGSIHQDLGTNTEASVAYRRHTDLFVLFRYSPSIYTNRHLLDSWQGTLRRHDKLPGHAVLSYGLEGLNESISSTNLGTRSRTRGSGYVFYDIRALRRFSLSLGVREEIYGSGRRVTSPSASGAAWLSSKVKVRASASSAFRLPSYTDLYYSDPGNKGNPDLKPEKALSFEGGVDAYLRSNFRLAGTVFQRRDKDVIDYVRANTSVPFTATNFDRLNFTGMELSAAYEPVPGQRVSAAFSGLHGVNAGGSVLLSKYAFNYPVQSFVADWVGAVGSGVVARTRIGAVGRLGRNPYAVWDASVSYSRGPLRPFLRLTNITSTVYQEIPAVALPSRGVLGGVEYVWAR